MHEPGESFVDHQLAVSQLVVDLTLAGRDGQLELLTVEGEPACWRTVPAIGRSVLRPDLFLAIGNGELEYQWFVEIDRGTHHSRALLRKARLYESYYQSGAEQAAHGVFPRVIWIAADVGRAERIARDAERRRVQRRTDARDGQSQGDSHARRRRMSGSARNRLLVGDVRDRLCELPAASIDCVITSPPYYQLRDYGVQGQLGLQGQCRMAGSTSCG